MVNSPTCTTDKVEWATIILTIIATNVTWWAFEIPLLFSHGLAAYFKSVAWQCLRNHTCGLAHLYAMRAGRDAKEWVYIYYIGPFDHSSAKTSKERDKQHPQTTSGNATATSTCAQEKYHLTTYQITLHLLADTISLIAAGLSIKQAVNTPSTFWTPETYTGVYNVFIWIYPTVPIALMGVYLLLCSFFMSSSGETSQGNRKASWIGLYALLALGAVAIVIPTQFISPAGSKSVLPLTIIAYLLMASPLAAASICCGIPTLVCVFIALLVRMLGMVAGALVAEFYFPFCALKSVGFAAAYGAVSVIGAGFAIWARFYFFGSGRVGAWGKVGRVGDGIGNRGGNGMRQGEMVLMQPVSTVQYHGSQTVQQYSQPQQHNWQNYQQPIPQYYDGRRITVTAYGHSQQQQHPGWTSSPQRPQQYHGYGWDTPPRQQWNAPGNGRAHSVAWTK